MDIRQVVTLCFFALSKVRLPRGTPPPEPNIVDIYKKCRGQVDALNLDSNIKFAPGVTLPGPEPSSTQPTVVTAAGVATACVPCLRGHMSAVSGMLTEAERMSRGGELVNPEVAERIRIALEEIVQFERKDATAEAILKASPADRKIMDEFLPRIRELRQHITDISTRDDLLSTVAEANAISRDVTLRHLESKGVDTGKLNDLAEKVKSKVMTLDEAREKVKELVR